MAVGIYDLHAIVSIELNHPKGVEIFYLPTEYTNLLWRMGFYKGHRSARSFDSLSWKLGNVSIRYLLEQIRIIDDKLYNLDFALKGTKSNIYLRTIIQDSFPVNRHPNFYVSSTHLFYANSFTNTLFEIPLTGQNISDSKKEILNFMPDSFGYHKGYIYFSFKNAIEKISIVSNSKPEPLIYANEM
ncbi:hypothetical protein ACTFIY_012194 [Dictyostelium cf. discoideum]